MAPIDPTLKRKIGSKSNLGLENHAQSIVYGFLYDGIRSIYKKIQYIYGWSKNYHPAASGYASRAAEFLES